MLVLGFVPLYWVKLIQLLGISYFIDVCINQLAYTTENEQLKPRIWWLGSDDLSLQFGDFLSSILIFRGVVWSPKKIHPSSNDRTEVFQCWRVEIGSCIGSFGGMICLRVKWTKGGDLEFYDHWCFKSVAPRNRTWQRKNKHLNMYLLLKLMSFHCHVSFQGHICVEFSSTHQWINA